MRSLIASAVLLISASLAQAHPLPCTDNGDAVAGQLLKTHGELPLSLGDGESKAVYRLFVNPETRTWTMVIFADKQACIIAGGVNFRPEAAPKLGQVM